MMVRDPALLAAIVVIPLLVGGLFELLRDWIVESRINSSNLEIMIHASRDSRKEKK